MLKPLILISALCYSYNAGASECLESYIDEYFANNSSQNISKSQIKTWQNWCGHGFNAKKLSSATDECYNDNLDAMIEDMGTAYILEFNMFESIQNQCRREFFQPVKDNLFSLPATIAAASEGYVYLLSRKKNSAPILARLNDGDKITTYSQNGSWWQVKTDDGLRGFVRNRYLHVNQ